MDIPKQYQGKYDHLLYQKLYPFVIPAVIPVVILFVIPNVTPYVTPYVIPNVWNFVIPVRHTRRYTKTLLSNTLHVPDTPCSIHTLYRTHPVPYTKCPVSNEWQQCPRSYGLRSQAPKHRFPSVAIRQKILTHPGQGAAKLRAWVRQSLVLPVPARPGSILIS